MAELYHKIVNSYTKFAQNVLLRKYHSACENRTAPVLSRYGQVGLPVYCNTLESVTSVYCNTLSNQLGHTERVWVPCVFRKQSGMLSTYESGTNLVYRLCYFGILMFIRNSLKFVYDVYGEESLT